MSMENSYSTSDILNNCCDVCGKMLPKDKDNKEISGIHFSTGNVLKPHYPNLKEDYYVCWPCSLRGFGIKA